MQSGCIWHEIWRTERVSCRSIQAHITAHLPSVHSQEHCFYRNKSEIWLIFCAIKTHRLYDLMFGCLVSQPCESMMHARWTLADLVCAYVPGTHELFWCRVGISAEHGKAESGCCSFQDARGAHIRDFGHSCVLGQQDVLGLDVIVHNLQISTSRLSKCFWASVIVLCQQRLPLNL